LPDGLFSNLISQFWKIFEVLAIEDFGATILWSFGIFSRFGILYREKYGNPALQLNIVVYMSMYVCKVLRFFNNSLAATYNKQEIYVITWVL
jgi:hypothetical protein